MKTVVFTKDYRDEEMTRHIKAGTLLSVDDAEAEKLVRLGVAHIREPHGPTETKGEA